VIDELVWEQTRRLLEQPDLVLQEYARRTERQQRQRLEFKDLLAKKRREIKEQELGKARLLDLYQTGNISLAEIEPRLQSLRSKIRQLHDECTLVEKEEKEEHHRFQLIEQFSEFTQRMNTNLSGLSFGERRQVVRLLVEQVLVNTSTGEITVRHILPVNQKFPLCKRGTFATAQQSRARRTRPGVGAPGTLFCSLCGRQQYLRSQRARRSAGDGERKAIHHAQAQAQGKRGEECGGATAGTKVSRVQLYGWSRGSARYCAEGLGSV
jgi:hypothetical protein